MVLSGGLCHAADQIRIHDHRRAKQRTRDWCRSRCPIGALPHLSIVSECLIIFPEALEDPEDAGLSVSSLGSIGGSKLNPEDEEGALHG